MNMLNKLLSMLLCAALLLVTAVPVLADSGSQMSMTYVNPLYPQLAPPAQSHAVKAPPVRAVQRDSLEEAVPDLREGLKKRETTITVSFLAPDYNREMMSKLFHLAIAHTGNPTEGDYLAWHYTDWSASMSITTLKDGYRNEVTYTVNYLSTQQQEKTLDAQVDQLLDQLNVYQASDYEKLSAVYDYLCQNITYDHAGAEKDDPLAHTAYAALIKKTSVCQGYASLLYRMMLALDVDIRVVAGIGNGGAHGWNIVKMDGLYYAVDATWDATRRQSGSPYQYFLRCEQNFEDHTRDAEYLTEEFQRAYPMAQSDYTGQTQIMIGDLDGKNGVTEDDAIYLLQHVLMPAIFPVSQAVDYSKNGTVDEDDAIYLLQHVLMPGLFPL